MNESDRGSSIGQGISWAGFWIGIGIFLGLDRLASAL